MTAFRRRFLSTFLPNAPDQLTTIIHTQHGDSVSTYDGSHAWIAASDKLMRVLPLSGGDLVGAKVDGSICFPLALKQDFKWRTGFPSVTIDDHPVQVIQEISGGETGVKLYFDKQSGLLLRQVRYSTRPSESFPRRSTTRIIASSRESKYPSTGS